MRRLEKKIFYALNNWYWLEGLGMRLLRHGNQRMCIKTFNIFIKTSSRIDFQWVFMNFLANLFRKSKNKIKSKIFIISVSYIWNYFIIIFDLCKSITVRLYWLTVLLTVQCILTIRSFKFRDQITRWILFLNILQARCVMNSELQEIYLDLCKINMRGELYWSIGLSESS